MGALSNGLIPDSHAPKPGSRKVPLWNCSQIANHRLSTSCGVVERPDHHCVDDLVKDTITIPWASNYDAVSMLLSYMGTSCYVYLPWLCLHFYPKLNWHRKSCFFLQWSSQCTSALKSVYFYVVYHAMLRGGKKEKTGEVIESLSFIVSISCIGLLSLLIHK